MINLIDVANYSSVCIAPVASGIWPISQQPGFFVKNSVFEGEVEAFNSHFIYGLSHMLQMSVLEISTFYFEFDFLMFQVSQTMHSNPFDQSAIFPGNRHRHLKPRN